MLGLAALLLLGIVVSLADSFIGIPTLHLSRDLCCWIKYWATGDSVYKILLLDWGSSGKQKIPALCSGDFIISWLVY